MKPIYRLRVLSVGIGGYRGNTTSIATTPFLLLAALYFQNHPIRSDINLKIPILPRQMKDFVESRTMTRRRKWTILIFADIVLTISFILTEITVLRVILILLFLTKHWYFYRFVKTENTEKKD
jgi:uncharacterized membrane protein YbaN (DUF454 family)